MEGVCIVVVICIGIEFMLKRSVVCLIKVVSLFSFSLLVSMIGLVIM